LSSDIIVLKRGASNPQQVKTECLASATIDQIYKQAPEPEARQLHDRLAAWVCFSECAKGTFQKHKFTAGALN